MERLDRLKAYKWMYGDCHVPYQCTVDLQLSEWCNTQGKRNNKINCYPIANKCWTHFALCGIVALVEVVRVPVNLASGAWVRELPLHQPLL